MPIMPLGCALFSKGKNIQNSEPLSATSFFKKKQKHFQANTKAQFEYRDFIVNGFI
jgi:hypothetical protein